MIAARVGRHRPNHLAAGCIAALLVACSPTHETAEPVESPTDLATQKLEPGPSRIVSLSEVATRFIVQIGAEHLLVGIDDRSASIPGLAHVPVVTQRTLSGARPDLVLIPRVEGERTPNHSAQMHVCPSQSDVIEVGPRDLDEVFQLYRCLGTRLVGAARSGQAEMALARPLAEVGAASFGQKRPRTLAIISLDPVTVAGGHSFETDLIEIAGGISITHANEDPRMQLNSDAIRALIPDLLLILSPTHLSADEIANARRKLGEDHAVEFIKLDAQHFWLDTPANAALRVHEVLSTHRPL